MELNKKAYVEDLAQLIAWMIVIIFVVLIILVIKTEKEKAMIDHSSELQAKIDADYLLIGYLSQKVDYHNLDSRASLIRLYFEQKDSFVLSEIEKQTEEYFSGSILETGDTTWEVVISDKDTEKSMMSEKAVPSALVKIAATGKEKIASIKIPDKEDMITVDLYLLTITPVGASP